MSDSLVLKIFCVDRQLEVNDCDCVLLSIAEDAKGRFSGSYGIKKGHAKAVFSLCEGPLTARKNGETVFSAEISDGFAAVENNTVSVTAYSVKEI